MLIKISRCGLIEDDSQFGLFAGEYLLNVVLIEGDKSLRVFEELIEGFTDDGLDR